MESRTVAVADEDVEVVDTELEGSDAFAAYFAEANKAFDKEVSYSSVFGRVSHGEATACSICSMADTSRLFHLRGHTQRRGEVD